jgi:peroxiredoxin
LRDNYSRYLKRNVALFGINPRRAASHAAFHAKLNLPFPLLVDEGQRIARAYRSAGLVPRRTVYAIDERGVIRFARRGAPSTAEILASLTPV